jgi:hypothetical protein
MYQITGHVNLSRIDLTPETMTGDCENLPRA